MSTKIYKEIGAGSGSGVGDNLGDHIATQALQLSGFALTSDVADGALAVGHSIETSNLLDTDGSKVLRVSNSTDEMLVLRRGTDSLAGFSFSDQHVMELVGKTGLVTGFISAEEDSPRFVMGAIGDFNVDMESWDAAGNVRGVLSFSPQTQQANLALTEGTKSAAINFDVTDADYGRVFITGDQFFPASNVLYLDSLGAADGPRIADAVAFIDSGGGGTLFLGQGTFDLGAGLQLATHNFVRIVGQGDATILSGTGAGSGALLEILGTADLVDDPLNNFAIGATSIFTTTAANAGQVAAGDALFIVGTDAAMGYKEGFVGIAAAGGNAGTGEITLENPAPFGFNSGLVDNFAGNKFLSLEKVKMVPTGTFDQIFTIRYCDHFTMKDINIDADGVTLAGSARNCIDITASTNTTIQNVRVFKMNQARSIAVRAGMDFLIENCDVTGSNNTGGGTGPEAAILLGVNVYGGSVNRNKIVGGTGDGGILVDGSNGATRILISGNRVLYRTVGQGISVTGGNEIQVKDNYIRNIRNTSNGFGILANAKKMLVSGNTMVNCQWGIVANAASNSNVKVDNNLMEQIDKQGIYIHHVSNGSVNDNTVRTCGQFCIGIDDSSKMTVNDNVVEDGQRGIIIYEDSDNVTIVGNQVFDMDNEGIWISGDSNTPLDNTVNGNSIDTCATGIRLSATQDNDVVGNRVDNCTTGLLMDDNTGVTDNNLVDHNNLRGNTTPLSDTSTGTNNQKLSNLVA